MSNGFTSTDPANHQGQTDTWLTPLPLIKRLGHFGLDPCAYPNHKTADRLICLPTDGLKEKWDAKVFCNPPYSDAGTWIKKLSYHGYGVALVFARTDTKWFQEIAHNVKWIQFIKGRVKFLRPDLTEKSNAGTPSIALFFGCDPVDESLGVIK